MKKLIYLLGIIMLVSGCATTNPNLIPVTNPSERISFLGLSVLPPKGGNWYIVKSPYAGIGFSKVLDKPVHTLACTVLVIATDKKFKDPQEFLEFVKLSKEADTDINRFIDAKNNYALNERFGKYCIEYNSKCKDVGGNNLNKTVLFFNVHGYTFIHPRYPNYVVDVGYSERDESQDFTPSAKEISEEFISNLRIESQ